MSEKLNGNEIKLPATLDSSESISQTLEPEDFTNERPPEPALKNIALLEPYKPHKDREHIRGFIAKGFFWLLTFISVSSFTALVLHQVTLPELKEYFSSVFAPIIAIVGTVTGFYYGSSSNDR